MLHHSIEALRMTGIMAWQILWALSLGFLLSSIVEAVVSKAQLSKLLPDSSPRTILKATALGAASSSCSYAATALARTLFRKGADFIASMAFQFASTNLVVELSVLLCVLLGWQFMAAEFVGGPIMIALLVILLRATLRPRLIEAARAHASLGLAGRMEGHAAMDMSLHEGTFLQKITSRRGITATSHYYWMDWYSLVPDVALGLFIAGILAAFVPSSFWQAFFLAGHPVLTRIWGPLIGPLVAVLSFVCSVGNVPLAAVLWNGGISFGGVISFLFADLLILPILNIYRKYYGLRVAAILAVTFYLAMAGAALIVEALFSALHLIPAHHQLADHARRHHLELHLRHSISSSSPSARPSIPLPPHRRPSHAARDGQRPRRPQRRTPLLLPRRTRTCPIPTHSCCHISKIRTPPPHIFTAVILNRARRIHRSLIAMGRASAKPTVFS